MESQHLAGASSQPVQLAFGLDGPPLLSNISSVVTDADSGGLNIVDIPLSIATLNGFQPNVAFSSTDDLFVSSANLVFNSIPDVGLNKMSDNNFLTSVDALSKNDAKSPLNIMVVSDGLNIQGQISPAISSQPNLSSAPFQSVVSGGDKMLSAVSGLNFNDPEMLGDAAFDSTPSGALPQFDDGLLSTLGSSSHGLRLGDGPSGTSFDLFDGGVGDGLSLSPQPFSDTGLISDSTSSVLDADSLLDGSTKQTPLGKKSPASSTVSPDLSSQAKFTNSQCPVCGKTFNNITALAKHRLTHSDERKYICNVCSKGFKRQDHLNGHLMTHLDKKPFECQLPNCDKGYCDQRSLRRHLEQHHHLDPETIQTHVQASMAAAGISPPTPRNGSKSKASDKSSEGRSKPLSSPVYSPGSATPTPSPGAGGTNQNASNIFHFDTKKQQQQQQELLVQQIHQQQKRLLQQQKLQKQQEEQAKVKESVTATVNDAMNKQAQLQLQVQQKQSKHQQNQKQPADMLAVMQEVQKLQQQIKQPQQLEGQKFKGSVKEDSSNMQEGFQWQDKAGVYTFVGTPTSSEQSPVSRSDQSPIMSNDLLTRSPVSPASVQPISPMTNAGTRTVWFNNSPDTASSTKHVEEPPKPQAYCTACDRYFKNAAALNGHMRCHGGFSKKGKGLENKKSPVRKSSTSSEMGPPLRRPPHTSTPSPQPIARTSPTTPTLSPSPQTPLTPTSIQSPGDQSSAIERLNGAPSSDQLIQSKHKLLQEQLSSHLLKRRMSGDQFQQRRQVKPQQQQVDAQTNQEQMKLLEEHIKAQRQIHQQQQQQQQQSPQNVQVLTNPTRHQEIPLQIGLTSSMDRPISPQQGEHIQRLVQSFQQVEELHLQQQQQQQQIQLSAEQLEQIRQEHKLIGLPPLNPEQLQFQLQEQQNQIIQAQIREQQLQEQHQLQEQQQQQQQNQLQVMEPASLVMSSNHLAQSGLIQFSSAQASNNNPQQPLLKVNYQPTDVTDANQITMPSQTELNSSVQHILATLDPIVVNAAGLNHQQLLAQLQKHQLAQQELQGMQFTVDPQNAELVADALTNLQVGQIPQILLQPPDPDDINGVPTISIPESVVLGASQAQVQQPANMETEQQQIERIQNGLMASVKQQQDSRLGGMPTADMANISYLEDMESRVPNFLNIQPNRVISNATTQSAIAPQSNQSQLRVSNIVDGSSTQNDINLHMNVSSSSISSPATSSAVARNTDAAVAQILKNISNSMAESGIVLSLGGSEAQPARTASAGSSLDGSDKLSSYHMSSTSPKHFLDSIKQDVMLSSAVNSNQEKKTSSFSNDTVMKEVPYSSSSDKKIDSSANTKRRLSADLESQRKISSLSRNSTASINPLTTLVNPLEVEGISAGRVRVRSKSGDVHYKYCRSKSVDQQATRHFSISEDSMIRSEKRRISSVKDGESHDHDLFSRSDGAGVFRNPGSLPSPLKIKRKHRPAPLYIPPQFGMFQSRLRSPRVITKDGHLTGELGRGHTPPPYTPPPMLSPFRSGSGLFCSLQSVQPCTPGSAPVSGKFSQSRRGSLSNAKADGSLEFIDQVVDETPAPETDTLAHINVGMDYQAVLPECRVKDRRQYNYLCNDKNRLLWHPSSEGDNTDNQLQHYQEFSCSAAVKGNGCNVEYALHLLHLVKGDLNEALLLLMGEPPTLPVDHPMLSYKYQESDSWNSNEMEKFYKAILEYDKDFFKISKEVETKSVKQCVQFYYVWKKVCPDDYKRLRHSRTKQSEYNTRRQAEKVAAAEKAAQAVLMAAQAEGNSSFVQDDGLEGSVDSDNNSFVSEYDDAQSIAMSGPGTAPSTANSTPTRVESPANVTSTVFPCTQEGCNVTCSSKQSLKRHMRKHQEKVQNSTSTTAKKPRPSTPSRSPVYDQFGEEIFPCRLCGRVFAKVKSRSAHMKSHKIAEQAQQEKRAAETAAEISAFVGQ